MDVECIFIQSLQFLDKVAGENGKEHTERQSYIDMQVAVFHLVCDQGGRKAVFLRHVADATFDEVFDVHSLVLEVLEKFLFQKVIESMMSPIFSKLSCSYQIL